MRTTLDLPEKLIQKGLTVSGCKTKTEMITTAIREFIQRKQISRLKNFKGKVKLNIDLKSLRKRS